MLSVAPHQYAISLRFHPTRQPGRIHQIREQDRQSPDFAGIARGSQQILSLGVVLVDGQHLARERRRGHPITAVNRRHRPIKQLIHRRGAATATLLLAPRSFVHIDIVSSQDLAPHDNSAAVYSDSGTHQRHPASERHARRPTPSSPLVSALQIRIAAGLHPLRLARHLGGVTVLLIMPTRVYAACEHQPCRRLSGEYWSVSRQTRVDRQPASRRWPKGAAFAALQPIHLACHAGALDVVHTALHAVLSP